MRVVIQRVSQACVTIEGKITAQIGLGLMVLIGIEDADTAEDMQWIGNKITSLRIFNDEQGVMNIGIKDCGGDILLVSQFTLFANARKGNRPSYIRASKPEVAIPLYEMMIAHLEMNLSKKNIYRNIRGRYEGGRLLMMVPGYDSPR